MRMISNDLKNYSSKLSNIVSTNADIVIRNFNNINRELQNPNFNIANIKFDGQNDFHSVLNNSVVKIGLMSSNDVYQFENSINSFVKDLKNTNFNDIENNTQKFITNILVKIIKIQLQKIYCI